ncbi:hypothetical protein TRFO_34782 [Tritrichomonas foetus]|uniref:F5/8 type C domain-containing protein n=1 Tax=Tritrichomonas foetus TaxID=1144522 RepID=A0A1J4JKG0_9EUKA|nr:hypothetical protein TRFO_34782 [Tritrichomonas foetus]|eukprot:OHS98879.1 hypothetical protein TRFO_34782 [Tritrichomonas foetus]
MVLLITLYLLLNEKSVFKLLSQRKIKINLSNLKETYHRIRNQSHKNQPIFQICSMKEIIDFCILNFEKKDVQEMIFQFLKVEKLKKLKIFFSSNNFQIKDEDSFFEIIINLIEERGEDFYSLLSFVNFVNLSNEKRTRYFDFLDPMKIEMKHWNYFITQIKTYFQNSLRLKYFIQPSTNHEFEGIFNRLNQECFGNCATKKLIDITCSSIKYTSPEFLFDYSTLSIEDWWTLKNENNGYIQIDFKDKMINLSHYSLHTPVCSEKISHTPKTWTIEGSNDLNRWNILDSRSNDPYTKNYNSFHCYECSNKDNKFYRYIRFYLRGQDHGDWYYSELSGIEFFGNLISC